MSSLLRYKKSGGFIQLLSLIETFGPQKKEKFIEMVESENVIWAKALREKMLTLERILSWPDQYVIEVFKSLPQKNLSLALEGLKEDQRGRLMAYFSASEVRRLDDLRGGQVGTKPEDISANILKVIELARRMLIEGNLRPDKFDVTLAIPEEFENKLEAQTALPNAEMHKAQVKKPAEEGASVRAHTPSTSAEPSAAPSAELGQLHRTLTVVLKENKTLKDEVRILREKLDQIKRIA